LSAFDTVQLEPITEPIPPEPTFDWMPFLVTGGSVIVVLLVVISSIKLMLLVRKRRRLKRNVVEVKWMRLGLKQVQKSRVTAESFDMDLWWDTVQLYLVRKGYISVAAPSIEEVRSCVNKTETLKHMLQQNLLELVSLVESEKYEGKRDNQRRERMFELFIKVYQELILIESESK